MPLAKPRSHCSQSCTPIVADKSMGIAVGQHIKPLEVRPVRFTSCVVA